MKKILVLLILLSMLGCFSNKSETNLSEEQIIPEKKDFYVENVKKIETDKKLSEDEKQFYIEGLKSKCFVTSKDEVTKISIKRNINDSGRIIESYNERKNQQLADVYKIIGNETNKRNNNDIITLKSIANKLKENQISDREKKVLLEYFKEKIVENAVTDKEILESDKMFEKDYKENGITIGKQLETMGTEKSNPTGYIPQNMKRATNSFYSRYNASEYLRKYATTYNPSFPNVELLGGDCTNFASQMLNAGGMAMDDRWFMRPTISPIAFSKPANSTQFYISWTTPNPSCWMGARDFSYYWVFGAIGGATHSAYQTTFHYPSSLAANMKYAYDELWHGDVIQIIRVTNSGGSLYYKDTVHTLEVSGFIAEYVGGQYKYDVLVSSHTNDYYKERLSTKLSGWSSDTLFALIRVKEGY